MGLNLPKADLRIRAHTKGKKTLPNKLHIKGTKTKMGFLTKEKNLRLKRANSIQKAVLAKFILLKEYFRISFLNFNLKGVFSPGAGRGQGGPRFNFSA